MTEKEIITKADFCVDIGLAYDWYKLIFKKEIPEWICEVLPSIKPHVQARKVAETVFEVDSLSFENKGKGKYFSKNSIDKKKIDEVIKRLKNL